LHMLLWLYTHVLSVYFNTLLIIQVTENDRLLQAMRSLFPHAAPSLPKPLDGDCTDELP
jgi:hypothetical protein